MEFTIVESGSTPRDTCHAKEGVIRTSWAATDWEDVFALTNDRADALCCSSLASDEVDFTDSLHRSEAILFGVD